MSEKIIYVYVYIYHSNIQYRLEYNFHFSDFF